MKVGSVIYGGGESFVRKFVGTINHPDDVKNYDVIILHGGADISPSLYNQPVVRACADKEPSVRDMFEWECIEEAVRRGVGIFGICRGAQLLCAFDGGTLFQHVDNHQSGNHSIITNDNVVLMTNSCHHQAMRPTKEAVILARCNGPICSVRYADTSTPVQVDEPEVEAVWWPHLNAVGVQGHPEWCDSRHPLAQYSHDLLERLLHV